MKNTCFLLNELGKSEITIELINKVLDSGMFNYAEMQWRFYAFSMAKEKKSRKTMMQTNQWGWLYQSLFVLMGKKQQYGLIGLGNDVFQATLMLCNKTQLFFKKAMGIIDRWLINNPNADNETICIMLLIQAIGYLQYGRQKKRRGNEVVFGMTLMHRYAKTRSEVNSDEAFYNLARAYHHLGLYSQCIFFYRKAKGRFKLRSMYNIQHVLTYNMFY